MVRLESCLFVIFVEALDVRAHVMIRTLKGARNLPTGTFGNGTMAKSETIVLLTRALELI